MKRILFTILVLMLAGSILASCTQLDVVGKTAVTSFESVLKIVEAKPDETYGGWSLNAPDQSARFFWSRDFSASSPHDVMVEVDAQPFINAGLDPAKLPAGLLVDGMIMVGQSLGDLSFAKDKQASGIASFGQLVALKRDVIGYHEKLDHYGVDLGGGNKFEWAKDMGKNDKDIVFILDPAVLIAAGVDPAKVESWVFAKVEIKDAAGKAVEVDKFLKPFDLA